MLLFVKKSIFLAPVYCFIFLLKGTRFLGGCGVLVKEGGLMTSFLKSSGESMISRITFPSAHKSAL